MNRREMLGLMGTAAAGVDQASRTNTLLGYPANETINIGGMGTGGRFRRLSKSFPAIPGFRLAADGPQTAHGHNRLADGRHRDPDNDAGPSNQHGYDDKNFIPG